VDITGATWSISPALAVSGSVLRTPTTAVLTTARQTGGQIYELTIGGVKDLAATPNTIAAGTKVTFSGPVFKEGLVQFERYNGGGAIQQFIDDLAAGTLPAPDVTETKNIFESGRGLGDNYRGRGYGWFRPPVSGDYVFFVAVDDNARVFLSTDDNPANKKAIAAEATWSDERQWLTSEEQRSDIYDGSEWPTFPTITLVQGNSYYIEALWQEGGGGDGLELTYKMAADADPAGGSVSILTGAVIGAYVDPASFPPPSLTGTTPVLGYGVSRDAVITWNYQGLGTVTLNTNTAKLKVDGAEVPVTMTQTGGSTAITYDGPGLYDIGRGYAWELSWNDSKGAPHVDSGVFVAHFMPASPANMFLIEGEDFNTGGGQVQAAVNTMPYLGGAYDQLSATVDVDYARTDATPDGDVYRVNEAPNVPHSVQNNENGTVRARDAAGAPTWTLTANYRLGWAGTGFWQNYTRQIPAGDYQVWASMSYGATPGTAINTIGNLTRVTSNPAQTPQTTEVIGYFRGPATGGWGANELFPLRTNTAASGPAAVVTLGGTAPTTLRFEYASADMDYFMLVPAVQGTTPTIGGITRTGNNVTINFTGVLYSADTVSGTWTPVAGATAPAFTTQATGTKYYKSGSQ